MKSFLPPLIFATTTLSGFSQTSGFPHLLIDDFGAPTNQQIRIPAPSPAGTTMSGQITNTGTLGGFRDVSLTSTIPLTPGNRISYETLSTPEISSRSGRSFASAISGHDSDWAIRYDANGSGLGADLLIYSSIQLLWESDHLSLSGDQSTVGLRLSDESGTTREFSFVFPVLTSPVLATTWDLSDFSASNGVDLSRIDSIEIFGNTDIGQDSNFTSLTAVPEPSSLFMGLLSTTVVILRRKRHLAR